MANTHMGQPPSNHVTLEAIGVGGDEDGLDFVRINPDGLAVPGPPWFRVPVGKVLVVTDVDWQYNGGSPRGIQTFRIFIHNMAQNESNRVFESTVILNDSGQGGISEAMTSGFVVSSAGNIEVDTTPGGGVISHILIRGYLCRES